MNKEISINHEISRNSKSIPILVKGSFFYENSNSPFLGKGWFCEGIVANSEDGSIIELDLSEYQTILDLLFKKLSDQI